MNLETNKEYSVKWKNHMSHVRQAFDQLLTSSELTDVTLSCEGQKIGAHKVLLSACSGYFRDTFKQVPCQHPVIILYGIQYNVLMDILHFIYNGEVSVDNSRLDTFLKIAKLLQISGLSDDLPEDTPMSHNETDEDAIKPEQITTELAVASDEGNSVTEPTSHDNRKCAKRSRPVESDTNEVRLLHKEKMQRQEDDALFLSDVKAEPSELISFDETLEDPLLQAEQPPDTNEFYGAAESTGGQEEYKIEVEEDSYEELDKGASLEKKAIPKNTAKTKAFVRSAFQKFCQERGYSFDRHTSVSELNDILADWATNMRKSDGTDYKESAVKLIWNGTAKMLQEMYSNQYQRRFNPFRDDEFKNARDSRNMKRSLLKSAVHSGIGHGTLAESERNKIYSFWDENTPSGLQRKLYHIIAYELGWRTLEAVDCLTLHFRKEFGQSGSFTGRIEYNSMFGKTGPDGNVVQSKWLVSNTSNPDVCPVRLLLKFFKARSFNTNLSTDRFFLMPNPSWNRMKKAFWYKDRPVGKNQIYAWNKEAAELIASGRKSIRISNNFNSPSTSKMA